MKIASWNVNSIRARQDLVLSWLKQHEPDVLCIQESKVEDEHFPTEGFQRLGYALALSGQPSYNGVAIVSRHPLANIRIGLEDERFNTDKRLIAAEIAGCTVYSAYVPNGKLVDSPSFSYKLDWLKELRRTLQLREAPGSRIVLCGDFNIAREARDVFDPEKLRGQLHFHPEEHRALDELLSFGLIDAFRLHDQSEGRFTWWDYRAGAFRRNRGLRIDYIFLSESLVPACRSVILDTEPRTREKPSDHIPVVTELSL